MASALRNLVVALLLGSALISDLGKVSCAVSTRQVRQAPLEPITLDDYLGNGALRAAGFSGQWAQGSDNLIRINKGDVVVDYNVQTGLETKVVNLTEVAAKLPAGSRYSGIIFSNDGNFALVQHSRSSVWRYSALAKYHVLDLTSGQITHQLGPQGNADQLLQYVKWTPTGNGIAFVHGYNIYFKADAQPGSAALVRQLTNDGADEERAIYNGISDWVYEEEMFGGPNAMWISSSRRNLAFVKFDDSAVEKFQWPIYGEPGSELGIYPDHPEIRYPKVGTNNPVAELYNYNLDTTINPLKRLYFPGAIDAHQSIIGTVMWATENQLLVALLNRQQTVSQWYICDVDAAASACRHIYTYQLSHGWVDMNDPKVSADGQKFIFIRSVRDPAPESYKHIVMFMTDGTSRVITSGRLSVKSILGWDEPNRKIYFSATFWNGTHADPSETQVYSVIDDGVNRTPTCITCNLQNSFGGACRENSVTLSAGFTRYIHRCGAVDQVLETTTRFTQDGRTVPNPGPTYINNTNVRDALSVKAVPQIREYQLTVGDNLVQNFTARARLFLPADFDENKKYPLLISVYGGPGSQNIGQGNGISWETTLVSDKDIIVGYIDGRGTSGSSTDHLFTLHRRLGSVELSDQITVTKHLVDTLSFIDGENTAIWGWSYGGYATAGVLEKDVGDVFKCGISVAPVTSWRYYDTIYTERYMGLPTVNDNLAGYQAGDLTSKAAVNNLRNKTFMLVHGNADDNVHYQNSMLLARAMEQNDIFFHQLSYPDENHGIGGPGMRLHLYHSLQRFLFDECFKSEAQGGGGGPTSPPTQTTTDGSSTIRNLFIMTGISFIIAMYV